LSVISFAASIGWLLGASSAFTFLFFIFCYVGEAPCRQKKARQKIFVILFSAARSARKAARIVAHLHDAVKVAAFFFCQGVPVGASVTTLAGLSGFTANHAAAFYHRPNCPAARSA
jgi:hypothetical protein